MPRKERDNCSVCGISLVRYPKSALVMKCINCRVKHPAKDYPAIPCTMCGAMFKPTNRVATLCSRRCIALWNGRHKPGAGLPIQEQERLRVLKRRTILRDQTLEPVDNLAVFDRDKWICQLCFTYVDSLVRYPDPMCATIDHAIPISLGGPHCFENCQLAHSICNTRRGNTFIGPLPENIQRFVEIYA